MQKAMGQAQQERDQLLKEHTELQKVYDKVNKRIRIIQHEKSQLVAQLQVHLTDFLLLISMKMCWQVSVCTVV